MTPRGPEQRGPGCLNRGMAHFWIRAEHRPTERRTPVVAEDAAALVEAGHTVTVERSGRRCVPDEAYAAAGCTLAEPGSWVDAPAEAVIVGLKELPGQPEALRHTHVFFGHAFKGQHDAADLLARFRRGGGRLLDVEYLTGADGRRLVAFGYWAGYAGASLGLLAARGAIEAPLSPMSKDALDDRLRSSTPAADEAALVVGAWGRSGRGAVDALAVGGITATTWDRAETDPIDRDRLRAHTLLVNCVAVSTPREPFVTAADLDAPGSRLAVLTDVTCDVTSDLNLLPVNTSTTSWEEPVRTLRDGERTVQVVAIDNLPSLLPAEASATFSHDLLPQLLGLDAMTAPWQHALEVFDTTSAAVLGPA